jgi:hypothetical protein
VVYLERGAIYKPLSIGSLTMGYDSIIIAVPAVFLNRLLSAFPSTQILASQRLIIYFLKLASEE